MIVIHPGHCPRLRQPTGTPRRAANPATFNHLQGHKPLGLLFLCQINHASRTSAQLTHQPESIDDWQLGPLMFRRFLYECTP